MYSDATAATDVDRRCLLSDANHSPPPFFAINSDCPPKIIVTRDRFQHPLPPPIFDSPICPAFVQSAFNRDLRVCIQYYLFHNNPYTVQSMTLTFFRGSTCPDYEMTDPAFLNSVVEGSSGLVPAVVLLRRCLIHVCLFAFRIYHTAYTCI